MRPLDLSPDARWKQRFRAWSVTPLAYCDGNPARALAVANASGVRQLCAWNTDTGELRALTSDAHGHTMGSIDPLGKFVYYLHDRAGSELGHLVRVPFDGGAALDITPDLPDYAWSGIAFSRDGSTMAIAIADRDGFRLLAAPLQADGRNGAWRVLHHTRSLLRGLSLSADGSLLAVGSTERSGTLDATIIVLDARTGNRVAEFVPSAGTSHIAGFSCVSGDARLLASSSETGFDRPFLWHPLQNERRDLMLADMPGDLGPLFWSDDARVLLVRQFANAVQRIAHYDLATDSWAWLCHPSGTSSSARLVTSPAGTGTTELWLNVQDSTTPDRVLAIDPFTGTTLRVLLQGAEASPGRRWRSFDFPSSEGATIQGWVATPAGAGPFPTILETHGGPTAVTTECFNRMAQAWLDHGFAFASINYRGSTTFGHAFQHAIDGDLGHREVDDMVAARQWLVSEGIADPTRVLLTGWSYGGYLTLQAAGRAPGLWAGGMAGIAIADWVLMYEDQAETLRRYQHALFGGSPQDKPEAHRSASPISYADAVDAPLLIIQGANDSRCPPRQMRGYLDRLAALNKPVEVHWFDAGHGTNAIELQIEHQELMLRFAYRTVGNG